MTERVRSIVEGVHELVHRLALDAVACALRDPRSGAIHRFDCHVEEASEAGSYEVVLAVWVDEAHAADLIISSPTTPFAATALRHLTVLAEGVAAGQLIEDQHLHDLLLGADSLQEFVLRLGMWLRAPVLVQSPDFDVLAGTRSPTSMAVRSWPPPRAEVLEHEDMCVVRGTRGGSGKTRPGSVVTCVRDPRTSDVFGYLVVGAGVLDLARTGEMLRRATAVVSRQLATHLRSEATAAMSAQRVLDALLQDADSDEVSGIARALGVELSVPCRVFALRTAGERVGGFDPLTSAVRRALAGRAGSSSTVLTGAADDCVIVVIPTVGTPVLEDFGAVRDEGFADLAIGVGPPARHLSQVHDSIRKARWALQVAAVGGADRPIEFEGLDLYGLVRDDEWKSELMRFATSRLRPLLAQETRRGGYLLETLAEVLRTPSLTDAAAALYVHHSTLRYRINRLEQELDVSLQNADDRFALELALRILGMTGVSSTGRS